MAKQRTRMNPVKVFPVAKNSLPQTQAVNQEKKSFPVTSKKKGLLLQ